MVFSSPALTPTSLVFEAGDEAARTENQFSVFSSAAVEGNAVNLAEIVHGDAVAIGGLALLGLVGAGAFGDLEDLLVDFVFGDFNNFAGNLDAVIGLQFDGRDDFIGNGEFEIGFGRQDLFSFLLVFGHGDGRLGSRLLAAAGKDFGRLFTNQAR